ncbi:MAG: Gmad2 immunoglobulin-like domain-containing protein [Patescibacteria group bacterium]
MAKIILTAIILLAVLAGVVILLDNVRVQTSPTPSPTVTATATPDLGTTGNIRVFSPQPDDEVGLPLVIKGEARTFEAAFSYRIKNSKGTVLVEGHSMTTGTEDPPAYRPFDVTVNYPDPKTASGSVEVFEYSAKDGSEINKVIVPVRFKQDVPSSMTKVFFSKGTPANCSDVLAVIRRVPVTETPVRTTLDELLRGVYKAEADAGYQSNINSGTTIKSVNLKSGVLTIDFDKNLEAGVAGSCRVTAIRAQITQTAKQFSNVSSVVISVDGKSEGVLQP